MLQSQQATSAGLSTAAAVGIGRLLMHSADACAELEQTEQLVALLVQSYVQPPASDTGEPLEWSLRTVLTPLDCVFAKSFNGRACANKYPNNSPSVPKKQPELSQMWILYLEQLYCLDRVRKLLP